MKIVDPSLFDVIKEGIEFQIPCSSAKKEDPEEELLPCMERNEGAVYWLQPKGGTVDQQEACICVNGKFYALNCKFEKAIFRSVRLTRDFQNYERLVDGTRKLVIPRRLFQEKLKTSRRNNNSMQKLRCSRSVDAKPPAGAAGVAAAGVAAAAPPGPDAAHWPDPSPGPEQWADPSASPAPAGPASAAASPAAPPFAPPAGPCPEPAGSRPWPRQLRSKRTAPAADRKRRKTDVDLDASFRAVEAALAQDAPPLMHTPQSLMRMLLDVFELEFPDSLPRPAVAQVLRALT